MLLIRIRRGDWVSAISAYFISAVNLFRIADMPFIFVSLGLLS